MFLTAYNLPHYLISTGIVTADSVVDGDFALAEVGRRNRNFKILRRKHPGIFFKQIKSVEDQAIATLRREAAFYKAVRSNPRYAGIRELVPQFVSYDERRHALAVDLINDAESIAERHLKEGTYREDIARDLGRALGNIHEVGTALATDQALSTLFTYQMPWPLLLDQIGYTFLDNMGAIGPALAGGIRELPVLQSLLSALRPYWQYDSLIHGDMKWDNCMVRNSGAGTDHLTIVDWELADIGDGAWDVAGIFKEYVMAVVVSAHNQETLAAQQQTASPIYLEQLRPSLCAFWQAYSESRRLPDAATYLDRAIRLTGARVVSAVLEYLYTSPQLGTLGARILKTSVNILEAPQVAASQLGLR